MLVLGSLGCKLLLYLQDFWLVNTSIASAVCECLQDLMFHAC
jgi:hypothetical protein